MMAARFRFAAHYAGLFHQFAVFDRIPNLSSSRNLIFIGFVIVLLIFEKVFAPLVIPLFSPINISSYATGYATSVGLIILR